MNSQEYEQKKRECWEEYCQAPGTVFRGPAAYGIFSAAFDRAYALGKEKETISQEDIEKAAIDYIRTNPFVNSRTATTARESFEDGAKFALGKQEKDTADSVIQGWVARYDAGPRDLGLCIYTVKPRRMKGLKRWNGHGE